ncbi:MAG: hypothetical protein PHP02_06815, partial [Eubacteriales bacterium]|nr:hypothetical protein [Eubacteriales bacterium]
SITIGAVKGFRQEKAQVENALGSLGPVFTTRVETGNNLLTVAHRHLPPGDERVEAVARDVRELSAQESLPFRAEANTRLEENAKVLLAHLENTPSVQADSRDLSYVTGLLPQALDQSAQWTDAGSYNQAALAFNDRLNGTFAGFLARLLGETEAQLFTP